METQQHEKSTVTVRIEIALPNDADVVAAMVGELLHEIMAAVGEKTFNFHHHDTEARARAWLSDGSYLVLLARLGEEAVGFLALYQSYALYTEGVYGTIPEFYVRPPYRSRGIGTALLAESKTAGQARGWRRLEVTTPPLPQFDRTLAFYQRHGFSISGGRKLKVEL
jgi:GNAT superfamily N-acetyltransferase